MAKKLEKNNKTMHVLSLLTADKSTSAQEEPSVKVIESGESRKDTLAEQIGEQLENALKEEQQEEKAEEPQKLEEPQELEEPQRPEEAQSEEAQEQKKIQENSSEPEKESDYVFVNMMEAIAKEHLRENQERFSTCTCSRCTMDVLALTLNTVQPRYVVVQKGAVSGLTSFFEKKYMTDLLVAMVQACIKVAKNPRH